MPLFSIIVVHYQGTIPHEIFLRGIRSLQAQTFDDYQILCYHDGPMVDPSVTFPISVTPTETRFNDWGHSLRDRGIRAASGDYIIHFNADNFLYPYALEELHRAINRPSYVFDNARRAMDTNDILIFPIKMMGMITFRGRSARIAELKDQYTIMTAHPPVFRNIDCMQLVMKRQLWLNEGGWYDKSQFSDGLMYEKFAAKYGYRAISAVLGEHH